VLLYVYCLLYLRSSTVATRKLLQANKDVKKIFSLVALPSFFFLLPPLRLQLFLDAISCCTPDMQQTTGMALNVPLPHPHPKLILDQRLTLALWTLLHSDTPPVKFD